MDHGADIALAAGDRWLHEQVRRAARSVLGLDQLAEDVARMNALGYDMVAADAESFELGRTFDVVLAADLIEHLANPGLFLARTRQHLRPAGRLVLTTPNPFALAHFLHTVFREDFVNDEHVAWYDPAVLASLLRRHGFRVVELQWLEEAGASGTPRSRAVDVLTSPLRRFRAGLNRNFAVVATPG
jgi:SAM-dependent methyltransferase